MVLDVDGQAGGRFSRRNRPVGDDLVGGDVNRRDVVLVLDVDVDAARSRIRLTRFRFPAKGNRRDDLAGADVDDARGDLPVPLKVYTSFRVGSKRMKSGFPCVSTLAIVFHVALSTMLALLPRPLLVKTRPGVVAIAP